MIFIVTTYIQHSIESPKKAMSHKNGIRFIHIGKEEVKLSLFSVIYIDYHKETQRELVELMSGFSCIFKKSKNNWKIIFQKYQFQYHQKCKKIFRNKYF